jgi:hypothetical protein
MVTMVTKDELLNWLEHSHREITQMLNQVDQNMEIHPGWTIRRVIAHFAGWDNDVVSSLNFDSTVRVPILAAEHDPNSCNAATETECETLSFEDIYQKWLHTYKQIKIVIRDLLPERMEAEFAFPWGQTRNA